MTQAITGLLCQPKQKSVEALCVCGSTRGTLRETAGQEIRLILCVEGKDSALITGGTGPCWKGCGWVACDCGYRS